MVDFVAVDFVAVKHATKYGVLRLNRYSA